MNYEKDSNQVISHYLNDCPLKKFSLEEERKLLTLAKNNDSQARETLILNNIRLVISIAKKYVTDKDVLDDLIQEGCIGIMKAIEKFDLSSPYRFSTYEVFWVKAYISRYVCQNDIIKRPIQVKYIQMQYWKLQQKNPDIELAEAAKQLQVSEKRLKNILDTCFEMELFENLTENNQEQNVINLEQAQSPEIKYLGLERRLQILNLLKKAGLSEKCIQILLFRYGIGEFPTKTLKELSAIYGVCSQRINQYEQSSFAKIRKSLSMKDIEELSIDILGCHRVLAMAQEDNNYSNAFFKKAWETVNHEKQLVKK